MMTYNPMYKSTDQSVSEVDELYLDRWKYFYFNDQEMIPGNITVVLGNYVVIKAYMDADHVGNVENKRSCSGMIIYVNNATIIWYIKHQNTVNASSFVFQFVVSRIVAYIIEAIQYKIRCFVVPVDGPTEVFCYNKSIFNSSIIPTSVLNKRHTYIFSGYMIVCGTRVIYEQNIFS